MLRIKPLMQLTIVTLLATLNPSWGLTHFSVNSSTVALWTFNAHSSGGTFADSSPNGFSLSNANNFALTSSPYDSAAIFTGTAPVANSYLFHDYASALTMGGTGQITYEVRIFLPQYPSKQYVLGTYDGVTLEITTTGQLRGGGQKVRDGSGYWIHEESATGVVPLNRWVDLAVAFDNSTGQANGYIDGIPIQLYSTGATYPITDPFRVSTGAFLVGNNGRDDYQFTGTIDEVRISNNLVLGAGLPLIVGNPPIAPSNLSYSTSPASYMANALITNNVPTVSGTVNHYSVSPALPAGLRLDSISGIISGTPTTPSVATNYTVTASNSAGSTTAVVNITVLAPSPPSNLSYSQNPAVYGVGVAITSNNPTITGTAPISYSVSPALPTGLTLNASTGTISGTPTSGYYADYFTITAANPYGTTSVSLFISTIAGPSYANNPAQYAVGTAIVPNSPTETVAGTSYTVSPTLPQGLTMDTSTGVISGTPVTPVPATNYTVTARNNTQGYSTAVTVNITVRLSPSNLSYLNNPALYLVGATITPNLASVQGTPPFTYSVSPALPFGMTLNTSTGTISGIPMVVSTAANYVVTASNPAGSTTVTLVMEAAVGIFQHLDSRMITFRIDGSYAITLPLPENAQSGRLEILDMKGVKIWESRAEFGNGGGPVVWDGGQNSRSISRGLYFARMTWMDGKRNRINTTVQKVVYSP